MFDRGCERLEVGVPDPRDVTAIGIAIVQRGEEAWAAARRQERTDRRVEPRRVLHEDQPHLSSIDRDLLEPAECRPEVADGQRRGRERDVERACDRERVQRVVGVVQACDRNAHRIERARDRGA